MSKDKERNLKGQFIKGHQGFKGMLGRHQSKAARLKIKKSMKGRIAWNKGKTDWMSKEGKEKLRKLHLGVGSPAWKGGITFNKKNYAKTYYQKTKEKRMESQKKYYRKIRRNMPHNYTNQYKKGRRYEYQCVADLKKAGFQIVYRSPQSRGCFDVIGIKIFVNPISNLIDFTLKFIQAKAVRKFRGFKTAFQLKERIKLLEKIKQNNFKWFKRMTGKPKWTDNISFEIWIWENYVGWRKYFLDEKTLDWKLEELS